MEYNLHFVHLTSFEVIKIELLDLIKSNSSISIANGPNSQGGLSINVANILQNIENHQNFKGNINNSQPNK